MEDRVGLLFLKMHRDMIFIVCYLFQGFTVLTTSSSSDSTAVLLYVNPNFLCLGVSEEPTIAQHA